MWPVGRRGQWPDVACGQKGGSKKESVRNRRDPIRHTGVTFDAHNLTADNTGGIGTDPYPSAPGSRVVLVSWSNASTARDGGEKCQLVVLFQDAFEIAHQVTVE